MERRSGILMHITSLPEEEGIGTLGKAAYEFVDFLKSAYQSYWQILPLGPVGYGNSPYQSFSAFAGNPLVIDLRKLKDMGLLSQTEPILLSKNGNDTSKVDFEWINKQKMKILKKAYAVSLEDLKLQQDISTFKDKNRDWLEDYSLFMALKTENNNVSWHEWDMHLVQRDEKVLRKKCIELKQEIEFWNFVQYLFFKQWFELKAYANKAGVQIIGDIPIYVSSDSSDAWAHPELFLLGADYRPISVAGCPPDAFTEDGQLWGNPIYNWSYLKKTHYSWWISRMKQNAILYDMIRIDHFRGFESFWEVPFRNTTARNGRWTKGPGYELFETINKELGDISIIAEDLGFMTEEVITLRNKTGYPGMNILEFAFDPKGKSEYLPHNCIQSSVAYIGTHDNETVVGWMNNKNNNKQFEFAKRYLRLTKREGYHWGMIRGLLSMPSYISIIQMQDILGLDNTARMNVPATISTDNWAWRMKKDEVQPKMIKRLKQLTKLYSRI